MGWTDILWLTGKKLVKVLPTIGRETGMLPPDQLRQKQFQITMTVNNETRFPIRSTGNSYFRTGRYWDAPQDIEGGSKMTYSICNKDYAIAHGCAGGSIFELDLPNDAVFSFGIGLSYASAGAQQASVMQTQSGEDACNRATAQPQSFTHEVPITNDSGWPVILSLRFESTPGLEATVTVSASERPNDPV